MRIELPAWAAWLDTRLTLEGQPVRHRVLFGGRGAAKSWTIAHKLIERAMRGQKRILCVREFQNSIRDSSKRLIEDIIERLELGARGRRVFTITEHEIRCANGSVFSFVGLNGKDAAIKSFEGVDLVWVEEAASISQGSIDALIPTIRREASEIWWSYNPNHATDPVDRMFRGGTPPPGSVIVEVHYHDNPWFPDVLRRDMDYDRDRDPEKHAHVWLGQYLRRSEAQVFSNWEVARFDSPDDANFAFGADWGYSRDPTVLVRCFIGRWDIVEGRQVAVADPKGRCLFVDYEAYKIGCEIDETPALFAGSDTRSPRRWTNTHAHPGVAGADRRRITADSARPETINYMKSRGFSIEAAVKGKGSVEDGIAFLKNFDIVVHPRCRHLIDELVHYSWLIDRQTNKITDRLADTNNHVIDALRYALEGARRGGGEFTFMTAGRRAIVAMLESNSGFMESQEDGFGGVGWGSVRSSRRGLPY